MDNLAADGKIKLGKIKFAPIQDGQKVSIGVLSTILNCTPKCLRDLEDQGILSSDKTSRGHRRYSVKKVCQILNKSDQVDEDLREELFGLAVARVVSSELKGICPDSPKFLWEYPKEAGAIMEFLWWRPCGYSSDWKITDIQKQSDQLYWDLSEVIAVGNLMHASYPSVSSRYLDNSQYGVKNYHVELEDRALAHFQSNFRSVTPTQYSHGFKLVSLRRFGNK